MRLEQELAESKDMLERTKVDLADAVNALSMARRDLDQIRSSKIWRAWTLLSNSGRRWRG